MNDQEYRELAKIIQSKFDEFELFGLTDMHDYRIFQGSEYKLPDGREFVDLMLKAFDRHLAVLDEKTVLNSIEKINENLTEFIPLEQALLHYDFSMSPDFEEGPDPEPIRGIPDISRLREQLRKLQQDLGLDMEPPGPDRGPLRGRGRRD